MVDASAENSLAGSLELLAPAGNWDCARAAAENGADAIYFGLDAGFNARARAANFAVEELPALLDFLHRRGLRGYVTLNTLVFSDELQSLEQHVVRLAEAGVDAVLVQDLGVACWLRRLCPDLELHASTQMTLTSRSGLQAAEDLGVRRVVLPRELSIEEISDLRGVTSLGLEAFVHGALCVAYSGQCLTSESLGGRSANRGQCAQACRLPYDLVCDGVDVDLADVKYLLSPQDLAAHALLPDMIRAGVTSFKIEGRLKTPEYVANVSRQYRAALDAAAANTPFELNAQQIEELELSFSRGFSPGWLKGCDHKMLAPGKSSAKQGVLIGQVLRVQGRRVRVRLHRRLAPGDGVVFQGDRAAGTEQGARVLTVARREPTANTTTYIADLEFRRDDVDLNQLQPDQLLWKTDDPQLTKRLRRTFSGPDPIRKTPLRLSVTAHAGRPLLVHAQAGSGAACRVQSELPLETAIKHPLSLDVLKQQLGRLGGSVYELADLHADIQGSPMAPLSVLGKLRKELIQQLDASLEPKPKAIVMDALRALREEWIQAPRQQAENASEQPVRLFALCRRLDQLVALLELGVRDLYAEFQDIRQYREAVAAARQSGAWLYLATPRIEKPGEEGVFRALAKHEPDGVLTRNLGGMRFFQQQGVPTIADFSLNAANEFTVAYLMRQGAKRVTASYDLNRDQIDALVEAAPADWLEVVIHQHMPMFHMEHCVLLRRALARDQQTQLRTSLRRPRSEAAGSHRLGASIARGCRLPQYAVQRNAAEFGGGRVESVASRREGVSRRAARGHAEAGS